MQVLKPLAVGDVRLASGQVLHVLCVEQADIEAAYFHIDAGCIGMQDRGLITPSMTLLSHTALHAGRVPIARMQSILPIEIAARSFASCLAKAQFHACLFEFTPE